MRVDEYNDFATLLDRYRSALRRLDSLGIRVATSSRIRTYEALLDAVVRDRRPAIEEHVVHALAFTLREIDELTEIVQHLPDEVDTEVMRLLQRLHTGGLLPDDEASTDARDSQYELYLGTVLRRAGLPAVHGQPDLHVRWHGTDHYLEAKRPSSPTRVDDRLRSAVHQIRALPRPGIIAMSLDQVVRPPMGILEAPDFNAVAAAVHHLVSGFVTDHMHVWRNRLRDEPVAALLLTARVPARLRDTGHLVLGSNLHIERLTVDSSPEADSEFLFDAVRSYLGGQGAA